MTAQKCPDDGTCHHECASKCFRVQYCGPLSNVYPGNEWPDDIRVQHGRTRAGRIEWVPAGLVGERGRINGNDVFHLAYPGEWSECFTLTSPLIFLGERMGWLGTIEGFGPLLETVYRNGERPSRAQMVVDLKADKEGWHNAKNATKALAEAILVDFAKSVLQGVDEPNKVG